MALIRQFNTNENTINYISSVAFFCAISCSIIMLRFRGFKATLNLLSGKNNNTDSYDKSPGEPICGAYRISRDEFFYERGQPDASKKITPSPSMVQLPQLQKEVRPFKSTNDLTKPSSGSPDVRTSTPNVTSDPKQTAIDKNLIKEQKKHKKQQQEELKKHEKLVTQERKKEEKLKKDREKQRQAQAKKSDNSKTKVFAPQPQQTQAPNPPQQSSHYSTNTLESSISRSSGPPPYSPPVDMTPNTNDKTGNTSFAKSSEESSWDMIAEHRKQINKQITVKDSKQAHVDLHYNPGESSTSQGKYNSEV